VSAQHEPKEPIEATQHRSPTFPFQHSDLLAQVEHLQRDAQAIAKENPRSDENRAKYIDHKLAVTRGNDSVSHIWIAVQTIDLKHQQRFGYSPGRAAAREIRSKRLEALRRIFKYFRDLFKKDDRRVVPQSIWCPAFPEAGRMQTNPRCHRSERRYRHCSPVGGCWLQS
jgi:hypothetical protein